MCNLSTVAVIRLVSLEFACRKRSFISIIFDFCETSGREGFCSVHSIGTGEKMPKFFAWFGFIVLDAPLLSSLSVLSPRTEISPFRS